jgi:predicted nucleic acid-binding protein
MLVFDTNVISELMRKRPDPGVVAWVDAQSSHAIWTTAVSVMEICIGIEFLPDGKRKLALRKGFDVALLEVFDRRILTFDVVAARVAALLAEQRRRAGQSCEIRDLQIAGIVSARKATLVTRNVKDFYGMGIKLIDPWDQGYCPVKS